MPDSRVLITVVSGSTPAYIVDLVSTLVSHDGSGSAIKVSATVNSADRTLEAELQLFPGVSVSLNTHPKGFASNHNATLSQSPSADYFVIANDDIQLPDAGVIDRLIAFMDESGNERIGVVSPRLLNRDGSLQPSTYGFPTAFRTAVGYLGLRGAIGENSRAARAIATLLGAGAGRSRLWAHDRSVDVDTLRGAFVVVRGATVRDVGLMDEVALVGFEEVEWHYRMRQRGWRIHFLADESITHFGSATVGGRVDLELEYLKGCINFFAKHRSPASLLVVRVAAFLSFLTRSLLRAPKESRSTLRRGAAIALRWKPDPAHQNLRIS